MSRIHVCPLSQVAATLETARATHVVSLLALQHRVPDFGAIPADRRLHLALSDIVAAQDGYVLPEADHIAALLAFVRAWDRRGPLLIHCYAGVSRSTAAAFIALCALDPDTPEPHHAATLRAASPSATPNPRLVALADAALGRGGRMSDAIAAIGRGADCFEGAPFSMAVPALANASASWCQNA